MIAIVDYGMGNLRSVAKAFEYIGEEAVVSSDPAVLAKADRLVLPGVGAFPDGMKRLKEMGLVAALEEEVLKKKKPLLGICLGMQLLCEWGNEKERCEGLGWIPGEVVRLDTLGVKGKIPHVGWNSVAVVGESPLSMFKKQMDFYFVHSFAVQLRDESVCAGKTVYGTAFISSVCKGNIFATQFHPEKSQKAGLQVLEAFVSWTPEARC